MKKRLVKVMTTLLLVDFICLAATGLWMRFGGQTEILQQIHAISGMIFILLVLYHWHLYLSLFFHLWKKPNHENLSASPSHEQQLPNK